jgi:hypothetical protein
MDFNLERQFEQHRSEFRVDPATGVGYASIRATARLANVTHTALIINFTGGKQKASKLSQMLTVAGFDPGKQSKFSETGIPDLAASLIVKYYAWMAGNNCNEYAQAMDMASSGIGFRSLIQGAVGYTKQVETKEEFIARQLPAIPSIWECRYHREFWIALENLYGLKRGQWACGQFLKCRIYGYFPEEVQTRLEEINPLINHRRKVRLHQHFDGILLEALNQHIRVVTQNLMLSKTVAEFKKRMSKVPKLSFDFDGTKKLTGGN